MIQKADVEKRCPDKYPSCIPSDASVYLMIPRGAMQHGLKEILCRGLPNASKPISTANAPQTNVPVCVSELLVSVQSPGLWPAKSNDADQDATNSRARLPVYTGWEMWALIIALLPG